MFSVKSNIQASEKRIEDEEVTRLNTSKTQNELVESLIVKPLLHVGSQNKAEKKEKRTLPNLLTTVALSVYQCKQEKNPVEEEDTKTIHHNEVCKD